MSFSETILVQGMLLETSMDNKGKRDQPKLWEDCEETDWIGQTLPLISRVQTKRFNSASIQFHLTQKQEVP